MTIRRRRCVLPSAGDEAVGQSPSIAGRGGAAEVFRSLGGKVQTLCSFDTLQVKDYSKFSMAGFSAEHKLAHHEKQFPLDLEKARQMGKELVQLA